MCSEHVWAKQHIGPIHWARAKIKSFRGKREMRMMTWQRYRENIEKNGDFNGNIADISSIRLYLILNKNDFN